MSDNLLLNQSTATNQQHVMRRKYSAVSTGRLFSEWCMCKGQHNPRNTTMKSTGGCRCEHRLSCYFFPKHQQHNHLWFLTGRGTRSLARNSQNRLPHGSLVSCRLIPNTMWRRLGGPTLKRLHPPLAKCLPTRARLSRRYRLDDDVISSFRMRLFLTSSCGSNPVVGQVYSLSPSVTIAPKH